jgi:hypothetical protein
MPAGAREVRPCVETLEDLADGQLLVREPAIDHAHQVSLGLVDDEMAWHRVVARHISIAVGSTAALIMALAGFLQFAATKALAHDCTLVLRDGALDLQEQLIIRIVRNRVLQEGHLTSCLTELLEQEHLVCITPRQAVGAQHGNVLDGTVADDVAQSIKARSVKPCAAVSLVTEDMRLVQIMGSTDDPGLQGNELAAYGLLALLPFGGHTGVGGDVHDGALLMVTLMEPGGDVSAAAGSWSRQR